MLVESNDLEFKEYISLRHDENVTAGQYPFYMYKSIINAATPLKVFIKFNETIRDWKFHFKTLTNCHSFHPIAITLSDATILTNINGKYM